MNRKLMKIRDVEDSDVETTIDGQVVYSRNELLIHYPAHLKASNIQYWLSTNQPRYYQQGNRYLYPKSVMDKMLGAADNK